MARIENGNEEFAMGGVERMRKYGRNGGRTERERSDEGIRAARRESRDNRFSHIDNDLKALARK